MFCLWRRILLNPKHHLFFKCKILKKKKFYNSGLLPVIEDNQDDEIADEVNRMKEGMSYIAQEQEKKMEHMANVLHEPQRANMNTMSQMFSKMFQSQQQQMEAQQKQTQDFLLHLASAAGVTNAANVHGLAPMPNKTGSS